jgi:hypothetical protein
MAPYSITKNRLPVRLARVVSIQYHAPCDDPDNYYAGPERADIQLESINCNLSEFFTWFLGTSAGNDFCVSDRSLIDIGGSRIDLSIGSVIEVSFNDVLDEQIESGGRKAKAEIREMLFGPKSNFD